MAKFLVKAVLLWITVGFLSWYIADWGFSQLYNSRFSWVIVEKDGKFAPMRRMSGTVYDWYTFNTKAECQTWIDKKVNKKDPDEGWVIAK